MGSRSVGFVYVLSNTAMPGMVKVGQTTHLSEDRSKKLRTTGVPEPFLVTHRSLSSRPVEVERRAHDLLAAHRVNKDREFFAVSPEHAASAVRQACLDVAGIQSWHTPAPVLLRAGDRLAMTLRADQILVLIPYPKPGVPRLPADIWQAHSDGDLIELMATDTSAPVAGFSDGDPGGDEDPVPYLDRSEENANGAIIGRERILPGQRLLWMQEIPERNACELAWFDFDCYCQVTCRSWTPRLDENNFPLLLNVLTAELTPVIGRVVRAALRMNPPELSMPPPDPESQLPTFGDQPAPPHFWLRQLNRLRGRPSVGH